MTNYKALFKNLSVNELFINNVYAQSYGNPGPPKSHCHSLGSPGQTCHSGHSH